jgi:cytosine/adenosine deaminase-related metal-dependent hydrolase
MLLAGKHVLVTAAIGFDGAALEHKDSFLEWEIAAKSSQRQLELPITHNPHFILEMIFRP